MNRGSFSSQGWENYLTYSCYVYPRFSIPSIPFPSLPVPYQSFLSLKFPFTILLIPYYIPVPFPSPYWCIVSPTDPSRTVLSPQWIFEQMLAYTPPAKASLGVWSRARMPTTEKTHTSSEEICICVPKEIHQIWSAVTQCLHRVCNNNKFTVYVCLCFIVLRE